MSISPETDRIKNYRGWVRIIGEPVSAILPKPFGKVLGPDPELEGYYQVDLDTPAIDKETGEELPVITELADNLRKIKYDKRLLSRLLTKKGLNPKDYELLLATGEGEYFLTRPGYFIENANGFLITRERKCYSWGIDWDDETERMVLDISEELLEIHWEDSDEYQKALKRLARKAQKTTTIHE